MQGDSSVIDDSVIFCVVQSDKFFDLLLTVINLVPIYSQVFIHADMQPVGNFEKKFLYKKVPCSCHNCVEPGT